MILRQANPNPIRILLQLQSKLINDKLKQKMIIILDTLLVFTRVHLFFIDVVGIIELDHEF